MGKQIDADKLIEHFINKTPNGWLVPICENESRWTLEGIISEIEYFAPTVEAIPKADYEARLKADLKAILVELQLQMEKYEPKWAENEDQVIASNRTWDDFDDIIQQKINALKAESEVEDGNDD